MNTARCLRPPVPLALRALPLCALALCAPLAGCGDDALSTDELIAACVRSTACDRFAYPRVANCIDAFHTRHRAFGYGATYAQLYRCVNEAGDCAAVDRCYGGGERCGIDFAARCDGATAVACDTIGDRSFTLDCSAAGLSCGVKASAGFDATCTPGGCDAGFAPRCDGARALSCADGVIAIDDCGAQGLTCTGGAQPRCVGGGGECAQGPACDGNVAVTCIGGRTQRKDCGADPLKSRCAGGACVARGDACGDELDRCAGSDVQSCIDGRWRTVSCGNLGLGPCLDEQNGARCGAQ